MRARVGVFQRAHPDRLAAAQQGIIGAYVEVDFFVDCLGDCSEHKAKYSRAFACGQDASAGCLGNVAAAMVYSGTMSTPTASSSAKPSHFLTVPRVLALGVVLIALLALLLVLSPAEQQLGNLVKIIFLHGALARTGLFGLMAAGVLGLLFLIRPKPGLLRWSNALQVAAMILFVVHFALSVIPTHATWGMWIAFDEPRTRMSLQIIGVGLIVILVRYSSERRPPERPGQPLARRRGSRCSSCARASCVTHSTPSATHPPAPSRAFTSPS